MPPVRKFEDLEAWQIAKQLSLEIYALTRNPAFAKDFGLKDQICRAAVSVMSNIAEGFERGSDKAFQSFLSIAKGSAGEVRSQLHVARALGYATESQFKTCLALCVRVSQMLSGMLQYLQRCNPPK